MGSGYNATSITTRTDSFTDGYYTMRGYYVYGVTSYLGNEYTFSDTY